MVEGGLIVLLVEGSTGINGVSHVQVCNPALTCLAVNTTLVEQGDSLVQILVDLSVNLGHGRGSQVTGGLVETQGQTLGTAVVGVFPTYAVVVDQLLKAVSTEGQSRSLDELLVTLSTLGSVNAVDDHIGLGDDLIVVVPCIVVVDGALVGVHRLVVDGSPTRSILVVVVVLARIVLVQTHNAVFTAEALAVVTMLDGHGLGHTVQCLVSIIDGGNGRSIADRLGGFRLEIILAARGRNQCSTDQQTAQ